MRTPLRKLRQPRKERDAPIMCLALSRTTRSKFMFIISDMCDYQILPCKRVLIWWDGSLCENHASRHVFHIRPMCSFANSSTLWLPSRETCRHSDICTYTGLDPLQTTPIPVSYTKYVTKHMGKIEMGKKSCALSYNVR